MGITSYKRAQDLIKEGLTLAHSGHPDKAREIFKSSVHIHPTAEGMTYLAWMEHQLNRTDEAIELCKRAIPLDPDFGNPFNDIGSYLISQGNLDEAIPWLKRAIQSKKYEFRHFPHVNLAYIFIEKKMFMKALRELQLALDFLPGDVELVRKLNELRKEIN
jgi:Tfp pilus assembly protein PilF